MRRTVSKICMLSLLTVTAAGCSSIPGIEEFSNFDLTSDAPDEREVRVHQVLTVPPDYQLRAPANGTLDVAAEGQANPYALPTLQEGGVLAAQQPVGTDPAATTAVAPAQSTQIAAADPNASGPASLTPGAATTQEANNWPGGVNPNHPDGTPKTANEINEELRQIRLEQERATNPNYGTILNIGSLFSD